MPEANKLRTISAKELKAILSEHRRWLVDNTTGVRADLHGADLRDADLHNADLRGADLSVASLIGADLRDADLSGADLRDADLSGADLSGAYLIGANLHDADLSRVNLRDASLIGADLRDADLIGANLHNANLSGADLRDADLSGATGLLDPVAYLTEHFELTADGVIVYKQFGLHRAFPAAWAIEPGAIIAEVVSPDRTVDCACGVNVSTLHWLRRNGDTRPAWRCLIRWAWLPGVVVPYHTDGKIRASRVELLDTVPSEATA